MQVSPKRNLGYGWEHETNTLYAWSRTCRYFIGTEVRAKDVERQCARQSETEPSHCSIDDPFADFWQVGAQKNGALDRLFGK